MYTSGQPTNMQVDIEFSEPLDPLPVTTSNAYLMNPSNVPIPVTLSTRNGGRVVRLAPTSPVDPTPTSMST